MLSHYLDTEKRRLINFSMLHSSCIKKLKTYIVHVFGVITASISETEQNELCQVCLTREPCKPGILLSVETDSPGFCV